MRFSAPLFALVLTVAGFGAAAPAARADSVVLTADQAERVHLRGSAADVVIANPEIAEVALIDPRTLVVTGKAPGLTSLVVFDRTRRVIWQGPVSVGRGGQVAMIRGAPDGAAEERLFNCSGVCAVRSSK